MIRGYTFHVELSKQRYMYTQSIIVTLALPYEQLHDILPVSWCNFERDTIKFRVVMLPFVFMTWRCHCSSVQFSIRGAFKRGFPMKVFLWHSKSVSQFLTYALFQEVAELLSKLTRYSGILCVVRLPRILVHVYKTTWSKLYKYCCRIYKWEKGNCIFVKSPVKCLLLPINRT